ncbi:MAG: glycosyltransferase [Limnohabitans sp.]|nr:glycosyltransferase [Limnohabitans sp.]
MNEKPLVSVICLNYNHSKYVIECLNSVKNQSYHNVELIIIDDYSTDNSIEIINNWLEKNPNIVFLQNNTNLGNTKSFNKAAKIAKGDYLLDLAADDVLLPDCIEKQIEKFQTSGYRNLGLVYGNLENINEDGTFNSYYFEVGTNKKVLTKRKTGDIYSSIISTGKIICSPSALLRKSVFDKLGGYDKNLVYEDLDYWIRLSRDYEIDFVDHILVKKRILTNSLGTKFHQKQYSKRMGESTYIIIKKALSMCKNQDEYRALLKKVHYEIILMYKFNNYSLLLKLLSIKLKIHKIILNQ